MPGMLPLLRAAALGLVLAAAAPARAQEVDVGAIEDSLKEFTKQYVRGEEPIQGRPLRGAMRVFGAVAKDAGQTADPPASSFVQIYEVYALRGSIACGFLRNPAQVRQQALRISPTDVAWNLARYGALFPLRDVAIGVAAAERAKDGVKARLSFAAAPAAAATMAAFADDVLFVPAGKSWAIDLGSFVDALDRNWEALAKFYLPNVAATPDWGTQPDDERRRAAAFAIATAEAAQGAAERCPRFKEAHERERTGAQPNAFAPFREGLIDLVTRPISDWPDPRTLPWWTDRPL